MDPPYRDPTGARPALPSRSPIPWSKLKEEAVKPHWLDLESLVDQALELAPAERASFLASIEATSPELRADVERWLRATEQPEGFLDQSGPEYVAPLVRAGEETGSAEGRQIGPYESWV